MKNKMKLIIFLVVIALVIGVATKVTLDFRKEAKIRKEIKEVTELFINNNINNEEANAMLERRVIEKGDYKIVEEAIKLYYKDLYSNLQNITFLLDEENEYSYLSSSNLKTDGPDFTKSKDTIANTKAQIDDYYNLFITYLTDEEVKLSYIKDKELSKYYIDFYLELTDEVNNKALKENLLKKYTSANNKLDIYNEVLAFLEINSIHWHIKKDNILFDSIEINDKFNFITSKLIEEVSE